MPIADAKVDAGGRNALIDDPPTTTDGWHAPRLVVMWLVVVGGGVLTAVAAPAPDMLIDPNDDGLHCSMARNRSRSQRRNTSSSTDRLRCGNSWTSISIALGDTIEWLSAAWDWPENDTKFEFDLFVS